MLGAKPLRACVRRGAALQACDKRQWWTSTPLRQFPGGLGGEARIALAAQACLHAVSTRVHMQVLRKLEERDISLDRLADMPAAEISAMLRLPRAGDAVAAFVAQVRATRRSIVRRAAAASDNVNGCARRYHTWTSTLRSSPSRVASCV